eukprot:scaffold174587_cov20-Prasinocladus_malaysianus.AAC.1
MLFCCERLCRKRFKRLRSMRVDIRPYYRWCLSLPQASKVWDPGEVGGEQEAEAGRRLVQTIRTTTLPWLRTMLGLRVLAEGGAEAGRGPEPG